MKYMLFMVCFLVSSLLSQSQWTTGSGLIYYNGGNVGIGTTNPATKLEVSGNITGSDNYSILSRPDNNYIDRVIGFFHDYTGAEGGVKAYSEIHLKTDVNGILFEPANTLRMVITKTGNVGIGVSNPTNMLSVNGSIEQGADGNIFQGWGRRVSWNATGTSYNVNAAIGGNSGDILEINGLGGILLNGYNGGKVGIGTETPIEKLDVNGNIKATGFIIPTGASLGKVLTSDANGNATWQTPLSLSGWSLNGSTVGTVKSIGTVDNYDLPIITNNTERMRILAGGSVVIGISSLPAGDAKLAVNGTIYSTKVKVTSSIWSDYVFYPGYHLRPLRQVEQYIQQHQHLPEVPSAEEVEKEGIDLGDNQATLLKKIEELTLYLIEQNKKLEEHNKMLQEQIKINKDLQREIGLLKMQRQ